MRRQEAVLFIDRDTVQYRINVYCIHTVGAVHNNMYFFTPEDIVLSESLNSYITLKIDSVLN